MYNYGRKCMRPTAATARREFRSHQEHDNFTLTISQWAMVLLFGSAAMAIALYMLTHGMFYLLNGWWV